MKPTTRAASIEFLFDEMTDSLLAYENPSQGVAEHLSEEILNLPLDNVRAREPAEIERTLGRLVLSFLNSRSSKGLNLPRDLEYEKLADKEYFAQLHVKAEARTPEALYELAVSLIGNGIANNSWAEVEQGEVHLKQAVHAGYPEAVKYQDEVWILVRPRLEQKLKR
ncbi:hypothetical protein ACEN9J_01100 [Variovorax sp. Varisp41]|uniref:hypothetical protein n=1 Tax=Variovorax sp. Varisp41 TaxID=3243033 RepID=UPI0039B6C352